MNFKQALKSLHPLKPYRVGSWEDYDSIEWLDENTQKPTLQELEAEVQRLEDEWNSNEYQRQRNVRYPKIVDQLDMLWHAIDTNTLNKTSDFYTTIKAVKDTYPKSE